MDALWREQSGAEIPFVGLRDLALMKMTQREKDYPIIGELARRLSEVADQLRFSRSAGDLIHIARKHPGETARQERLRPLLALAIAGDRNRLAEALDAERRHLIQADAARLAHFQRVAANWAGAWPKLEARLDALPLEKAHAMMCETAVAYLPFAP